jgi:hypothetical protein
MTPGAIFTTVIYFAIYKMAQNPVLHYSRLEMLVRDKHSSLFGPFVSYKENEVV